MNCYRLLFRFWLFFILAVDDDDFDGDLLHGERTNERLFVLCVHVYKFAFILLNQNDCHSFHECLIMCDNFIWILMPLFAI